MTAPWLSVIVPTYNGAAYLPSALKSVAAQTDDGVEVVAVDDGSTDATVSILESFAGRLRMTVVRRRVGSWVANTNLGLERAAGEWVCFLHQDDHWLPGRLSAIRVGLSEPERQRGNGLERVPRVACNPCVFGRHGLQATRGTQWSHPRSRSGSDNTPSLMLTAATFITAAGRSVGPWRCPLAPGPRGNDPPFVASRLLVQNFVPLPAAVFRRADALALGGLDTDLWYTADWDLWLKLAARGPTRYLPRPTVAFRLHPESQTVKRSGGMADFRRQHEVVWERHWPRCRSAVANPQRVATAARLSVEVNLFLAGLLHRGGVGVSRLAKAVAAAGPAGWTHFAVASRLGERVAARLRAGLGRQ